MASGQQKAQQNLEAFEVWKATQTDHDFKQIVFRGQLNRIEVAKGITLRRHISYLYDIKQYFIDC